MQLQPIAPQGSFLKNLVLSVLLLGLSSLLIPAVLKQIDDRKFVDQQRIQAELSRQEKIIDEQAHWSRIWPTRPIGSLRASPGRSASIMRLINPLVC